MTDETLTHPECVLENVISKLTTKNKAHYTVVKSDADFAATLQYHQHPVFTLTRVHLASTIKHINEEAVRLYLGTARTAMSLGLQAFEYDAELIEQGVPVLNTVDVVMDCLLRYRNYNVVALRSWADEMLDSFQLIVGKVRTRFDGTIVISLYATLDNSIYLISFQAAWLLKWINYQVMDIGTGSVDLYRLDSVCPYASLVKEIALRAKNTHEQLPVQGEHVLVVSFTQHLDLTIVDRVALKVREESTGIEFTATGGMRFLTLLNEFSHKAMVQNGSFLLNEWGFFINPFTPTRTTVSFEVIVINGYSISIAILPTV